MLDAGVGDGERVDQLRLLEELKGAAAAAQARVTSRLRPVAGRGGSGPGGSGGGRPGRVGSSGRPASRSPPSRVGHGAGGGDAAHPGRVVPGPDQRVAGHLDGPRDRRPDGRGPAPGRCPAGGSARAPRRPRGRTRGAGVGLSAGSRVDPAPRPPSGRGPSGDVAAGTGHDDVADRVPAGRPGSRRLRRADPRRRRAQTARRPPQPGPADGRPDGRPTDRPDNRRPGCRSRFRW